MLLNNKDQFQKPASVLSEQNLHLMVIAINKIAKELETLKLTLGGLQNQVQSLSEEIENLKNE